MVLMGVLDLVLSGELYLINPTAMSGSVLNIAAGYASPPEDKLLEEIFLQLSVIFLPFLFKEG